MSENNLDMPKKDTLLDKVELRPIADLVFNPDNPREIKDEEIAALADSIAAHPRYFTARPVILSDRTGVLIIIAGEQRTKAAQYLGRKEVPTILLSGLTEEEESEIMIRDNTHAGKWNVAALVKKWAGKPLAQWGVEHTFIQKQDWEKAARISDENAPEDPALFYRITVKIPSTFSNDRAEIIAAIREALGKYEGAVVGGA